MPYDPDMMQTQVLIMRQMELDAMQTLAEYQDRKNESPLISELCEHAEAILEFVRGKFGNSVHGRNDPLGTHLQRFKQKQKNLRERQSSSDSA